MGHDPLSPRLCGFYTLKNKCVFDDGFPLPTQWWYISRPQKYSLCTTPTCEFVSRRYTKRRNKNACKIGNGKSIIAVMYLSRNYKVACLRTSVIARSDQESPLIRRCYSFPARNTYIWVGTRIESKHLEF